VQRDFGSVVTPVDMSWSATFGVATRLFDMLISFTTGVSEILNFLEGFLWRLYEFSFKNLTTTACLSVIEDFLGFFY
jgi:hypothetical protein